MISLARRLAMRQEVEALFEDLAEDDGADFRLVGVTVHAAPHRAALRPCAKCCEQVHDARAKWCPKCVGDARRAAGLARTLAAHEQAMQVKPCRACSQPLGPREDWANNVPLHKACRAEWVARRRHAEQERRARRRRLAQSWACVDCSHPLPNGHAPRCGTCSLVRTREMNRARSLRHYHASRLRKAT